MNLFFFEIYNIWIYQDAVEKSSDFYSLYLYEEANDGIVLTKLAQNKKLKPLMNQLAEEQIKWRMLFISQKDEKQLDVQFFPSRNAFFRHRSQKMSFVQSVSWKQITVFKTENESVSSDESATMSSASSMAQESDCQIDLFFQDEFDVGTVEGSDYSIFITVSNNLSNHSAEE